MRSILIKCLPPYKMKWIGLLNERIRLKYYSILLEYYSIQVNSFSRIGTKICNEMPVSLRKLPKNAFKRKKKQTLFEILASEDCYIDLPEIVQKVKLNLFSS